MLRHRDPYRVLVQLAVYKILNCFFLDNRHKEKYEEVYEMVRTIVDENGGDCPCEFIFIHIKMLFK